MADQSDITFAPKPATRGFMDLAGRRFERLEVLGYAGRHNRRTAWYCRCDCGTIKIVEGANLSSGNSRSCGCLSAEMIGDRMRTHGACGTPEHEAYRAAKKRCTLASNANYAYYGGAGIEFRYHSFDAFLADVGARPGPGFSIERKDRTGHYEPGNCRWATRIEQANNTRANCPITAKGMTMNQSEWARHSGIGLQTIASRRHRGWCDECAVTIPAGGRACIHRHDNVIPHLVAK